MKQLDFIIIGAQKSATTSLYRYLNPHPSIFMSSNKEAPFFSDDKFFNEGWDKFSKEFFKGASKEKLWGTASPQYMGNKVTAKRIYDQMPKTRLIALLRNPVERAYSHYTMSSRRDFDNRSFDQAVDDLIQEETMLNARNIMPVIKEGEINEDESNHYLVWGEYGRILQEFLKYFPQDQLLVLFMDDMANDPVTTYKKVIKFIGINDDFVPANVGKIYHKGGKNMFIPEAWRSKLKNNSIFRFFWKLIPDRIRTNARVWYDHKNIKKDNVDEGPSDSAKSILIDYYAKDIKLLEDIIGTSVPWKEFQLQG